MVATHICDGSFSADLSTPEGKSAQSTAGTGGHIHRAKKEPVGPHRGRDDEDRPAPVVLGSGISR
jgi:hypothetical protein